MESVNKSEFAEVIIVKKPVFIFLCSIIVLLTVSCGVPKNDNPQTDSINIEELKEKYPEYFEMSDFKGIEVYVWQMSPNSYRCGMLSGTNREKTNEEISALQFKSLSIEEAKAILNELGVAKEDIIVLPVSQAYSSYFYVIDEEYEERVNNLFR